MVAVQGADDNCQKQRRGRGYNLLTSTRAVPVPGSQPRMNEYLLLKFAHILAFVYWLGGDLGTFLASREVVNRENSPESRHVALTVMLACDMGPKLSMPLILPLGLQMAAMSGWMAIPTAVLAAIWALCLYWFGVVLVLYLNEGKPFTARLSRLDFWFRIAFAGALAAWAVATLLGDISPGWLGWKLLLFTAMVACGVMIRLNLAPFVPAFGDLMANGPSEENNSAMERSIGRCRPWVWCIWAGLFLNAALGLHLLG